MNVELSERARQRIQQLVDDGTYPSAEAVVDAAIRVLDASPRFPTPGEIEAAAELGRADFAAGRFREGDEFARELRAHLRDK